MAAAARKPPASKRFLRKAVIENLDGIWEKNRENSFAPRGRTEKKPFAANVLFLRFISPGGNAAPILKKP